MPVAERQRETGTWWSAPPSTVPHNRPDTGPGARTRKGADAGRVSLVEGRLTTTLEPTDKLDAMPRADNGDAAMVNGPKDELLDWSQIDWDAAEGQVRRLRQRIFTASQAGDLAKVIPEGAGPVNPVLAG